MHINLWNFFSLLLYSQALKLRFYSTINIKNTFFGLKLLKYWNKLNIDSFFFFGSETLIALEVELLLLFWVRLGPWHCCWFAHFCGLMWVHVLVCFQQGRYVSVVGVFYDHMLINYWKIHHHNKQPYCTVM